MSRTNTLLLTGAAMCAFAANSVLCRLALVGPAIDPASFTAIRIVSGAVMLVAIAAARGSAKAVLQAGEWRGALALFVYAIAFSLAYVVLHASAGALILFGAVQATMLGVALARGERLSLRQSLGAFAAALGLFYLLAPGLAAPPLGGAALMALAGIAWGLYSLIGRSARSKAFDPALVTAGNFLRAAPFALAVLPAMHLEISGEGVWLAVISGALTSGCGYVIWYGALKGLKASEAGIVQLTVPVLAALGGLALVHEPITLRFALAASAVVGGAALVLMAPPPKPAAR